MIREEKSSKNSKTSLRKHIRKKIKIRIIKNQQKLNQKNIKINFLRNYKEKIMRKNKFLNLINNKFFEKPLFSKQVWKDMMMDFHMIVNLARPQLRFLIFRILFMEASAPGFGF